MHFHPSTIPTSVRIGSSAELLPDYFSREGLVQTTSFPFTPIVPTFVFESTSSLAFSAAVRPYFSASRISLTTDSFRVRSVFARRLRSSRICAFFPHLAVRNNFISQPSLFSRRWVRTRLGYATLLSAGASRFSASWKSGLIASSRRSAPSSIFPVLSGLVGGPVHFVGVNALSLARYGRDREAASNIQTSTTAKEVTSLVSPSRAFLYQRESERGSRYAAVAAALPDLLRLTFLSLYLKKAPFLARVLAHSLTTLPRNRKETLFLRFLRKLVKVFAAQRPERLGIRLRVQGRVNRWRRTKHRVGERGRLPLYSYSARLEYGEAQALTRKGALGFRLWFAYHPGFAHRYRRTLLSYIRCSAF